MRTILIGLVTLCSYVVCLGQVDTTNVPFVSYWSKGDSYDFKITKIKERWKEGSLIKNDSSSYVVTFEVIDSTETNYKIKWSFKTDLRKFNIPPKLFDKFSKYKMTEVIYTTSEVGEFIGIENWKEVGQMVKDLAIDIADVLVEESNINKADFNEAMQPLLNIYETKQGVELLIFKEIQMFHFPFGIEFSATELLEYEEQLPNLFGGDPIKGNAKIYFESVDFENSFCIMIQEMKLNPEDTKNILVNLMKQMKVDDAAKEMKASEFDIQDYNKFEFYYYPGVPLRIETRRETKINLGKNKDKGVEITRIELLN